MNKKTRNLLVAVAASLLIICFICVLIGVFSDTPTTTTTSQPNDSAPSAPQSNSASPIDKYMDEYGGNPEVYTRILSMNDCIALQAEFDQAESNLSNQQPGTAQYKWGIGYMQASDDRMIAIGCHE